MFTRLFELANVTIAFLDCTNRQNAHGTAGENGVEIVKKIDIAKIAIRISIIDNYISRT